MLAAWSPRPDGLIDETTPLLDGKEWSALPERDSTTRARRSALQPSSRLLRAAIVLASLSSAFVAMMLWQLPRARMTVLAPFAVECDPFATPGWLDIDLDNAESARWRPFDPSCRPSHLLPEARDALYNSSLDDAAVRARLPWMVGRTLLKLGDSVDRCARGSA